MAVSWNKYDETGEPSGFFINPCAKRTKFGNRICNAYCLWNTFGFSKVLWDWAYKSQVAVKTVSGTCLMPNSGPGLHLKQRWWSSLMPIITIPLQCVNTLRPRQNGCHFADDILKCIFLNENVWIPIEISLKLVPEGPIDNILALV